MTKVLFLPEVVDQFLELAEVLYNNGYLGFKESAIAYAEQLFKDIQHDLPLKVKKDAPSDFKGYDRGSSTRCFPKTGILHGMSFTAFTRRMEIQYILFDI